MTNPKRLVYGENWVIGIIIPVPVSWLRFWSGRADHGSINKGSIQRVRL
jgi:hypothetical protein